MHMNAFPVVLAVLVSSTLPAMATDSHSGQCCPLGCLRIDPQNVLEIGLDGRPREISAGSFGRLHISGDAAVSVSSDGDLHVCMGYSAFGDPYVKCVQMPAPMM